MLLDDITAELVPAVRRARICVRGDLVEQVEALTREAREQEKADERLNTEPQAPAIWVQVEALREEAKAAEREFAFRSIGKRAWSDLAGKHPPTDDQRKAFASIGQLLDHNPETFPVHAMAASLAEIDGGSANATVEGLQTLEAKLTLGQWQRLWQACLDANVGVGDLGKSGAATAGTRLSAMSSTTAANGDSPEASSSAA